MNTVADTALQKSSHTVTPFSVTTTIEIALLAPNNDAVEIIGSFNGWQPQAMVKRADGWWRIQLNLADGDYEYRFRVKSKSWFSLDQWVEISDPRAMQINPFNNEASVLRVRSGRRVVDEYVWQHDTQGLPADADLVIYELHIGGFAADSNQPARLGTFASMLSKLDYLVQLGVNAIELMPVHEFPYDYSWGYNPRFHFAPESAYGTPTDLKKLVDEGHARGIRVILDMVFNHGENDHPLAKIDYDYWFYHDNPDAEAVRYGPKFDYTHFDEARKVFPAREFARDCALYWLKEYHLDGFRFDATALINNFDFLRWLRDELKAPAVTSGKPVILIAEHIPQDPAITGLQGPMDAAWHMTFHDQIKANLLGREHHGRQPYDPEATMAVLDPRREGFGSGSNVVNFTASHDTERELARLGSAGIFDEVAFRRAKQAAAILFTAPGLPMVWMGEEFGEFAPKTLESMQLHWELLPQPLNQGLFKYYSSLILLRKTTEALQHGNNIEFFFTDAERKLFAFRRWDDKGGVVVVVVNLQEQAVGEIEIPNWPGDGKWHEWTLDYDIEVQGKILRDKLTESQVKIYIGPVSS